MDFYCRFYMRLFLDASHLNLFLFSPAPYTHNGRHISSSTLVCPAENQFPAIENRSQVEPLVSRETIAFQLNYARNTNLVIYA